MRTTARARRYFKYKKWLKNTIPVKAGKTYTISGRTNVVNTQVIYYDENKKQTYKEEDIRYLRFIVPIDGSELFEKCENH